MQDSTYLNRAPLQQVGIVSPVPQAVVPPTQVVETVSSAPRAVENYSLPAYSATTPGPPRVVGSSYGSVSPGVASVASLSPGVVSSSDHVAARYGTANPGPLAYGPGTAYGATQPSAYGATQPSTYGTTQQGTYGQVGATYPSSGVPQSMEQTMRNLTPFTNSVQRSMSLR